MPFNPPEDLPFPLNLSRLSVPFSQESAYSYQLSIPSVVLAAGTHIPLLLLLPLRGLRNPYIPLSLALSRSRHLKPRRCMLVHVGTPCTHPLHALKQKTARSPATLLGIRRRIRHAFRSPAIPGARSGICSVCRNRGSILFRQQKVYI